MLCDNAKVDLTWQAGQLVKLPKTYKKQEWIKDD